MTRATGPAGRHRVNGPGRTPDDVPAPDPAAGPVVDEGGPAGVGGRRSPAGTGDPISAAGADGGSRPTAWTHPTVPEHPDDRGYPALGERPSVRPQRGDGLRTVVRGLGELLVTCGAVLLLFIVYEVWASNVTADRKQDQVHRQLTQLWQRGQDPLKGTDRLNLPIGRQVVLPAGEGFANLYIPAFGKDFARTIVQGTSDDDLNAGPGHYVTSQLPGQLGNFAVAGHRVGKGEPFLNLDRLRPGDTIVVQTARNWYVYAVLGNRAAYLAADRIADRATRDAAVTAALATPDSQGVPGREIVTPDAVQVIDPVPGHPNATATRALLTLTTCHPKYSARQRMVVHARLVRAVPNAGTALPRELPGGTA